MLFGRAARAHELAEAARIQLVRRDARLAEVSERQTHVVSAEEEVMADGDPGDRRLWARAQPPEREVRRSAAHVANQYEALAFRLLDEPGDERRIAPLEEVVER